MGKISDAYTGDERDTSAEAHHKGVVAALLAMGTESMAQMAKMIEGDQVWMDSLPYQSFNDRPPEIKERLMRATALKAMATDIVKNAIKSGR